MPIHVKILGIAGSPRHGNTDILVREALKGASELPHVETNFISLAGKKIEGCDSDYLCFAKAREGTLDLKKSCPSITDDADEILVKMLEADGIIIGNPVYWGGITAQLKALIDRTMGFEALGFALRNKVAGVVVTAYDRQGGHELTMQNIITWILMMDMIPVSIGPERRAVKEAEKPKVYERGIGAYLGAAALDSLVPPEVYERRPPGPPYGPPVDGVNYDRIGLGAARLLGKRVAEMAKVIKAGFDTVPPNELAWPRGRLEQSID